MHLSVHLLPRLVEADSLRGGVAVVIDVLRATTTISHALAAGATAVIPCLEVEHARRLQGQTPTLVLGGERGGEKIAGFDCGNSPAEYTTATVAGRCVAFTTTNGTRAIRHCRHADRILIAGFVNVSAVCNVLVGLERVNLVCSGTNDAVTREDALLAGAIVSRMGAQDLPLDLNDEARLARDAWHTATTDTTEGWLARAVADSHGGRNLTRLGYAYDIAMAAAIDQLDIVPEVDARRERITLPSDSCQSC